MYYDKRRLHDIKMLDDRVLPKGIYSSLISFIPRLRGGEYGEVYPKKQSGDGSVEKPYQMPYFVYNDVVSEFERVVYGFEKEHPEFRLNQYMDIMLLNGLRWDEESMAKADVSHMNGQGVLALILGAIRAERFCSGALNSFLEQGCIDKWLTRLQEIEKKE